MLLAVDTSTAQVGLALYDGALVVSEYAWRSSQRHTVELAPAVHELLARCGVNMDHIRALGVALGPGSFTSLRVGLSLVKGMAIARGLPVVGVPTLDILAGAQAAAQIPMVIVIQAGRGRLAAGWYRHNGADWQAQGPARVMTPDTLMDELTRPAIVCGELTAEARAALEQNAEIRLVSPAGSVRRPAVLAEMAWLRWQAGAVDNQSTLAPVYLHVAGSIPA